jgi:hypothetical protein
MSMQNGNDETKYGHARNAEPQGILISCIAANMTRDADTITDLIVDDPNVYRAWFHYGVGPRRDWVKRIVMEYLKVEVNTYA